MHIVLLILFLAIGNTSYAQNSVREQTLDRTYWKEITKDIDYSGVPDVKRKDKTKKDKRNQRNNYERYRQNMQRSATGAAIFKVLLILVLALLIAFIIFRLLGANLNFNTHKKVVASSSDINLDEIENNLQESELEGFIRQAISEGNFALAIRLYFLQAIKDLSLKKLIRWKRDKTNRDYQRELNGSTLYKDFQRITRIFERVWYGQNAFNREDFQKVEPLFLDFLKRLNRT